MGAVERFPIEQKERRNIKRPPPLHCLQGLNPPHSHCPSRAQTKPSRQSERLAWRRLAARAGLPPRATLYRKRAGSSTASPWASSSGRTRTPPVSGCCRRWRPGRGRRGRRRAASSSGRTPTGWGRSIGSGRGHRRRPPGPPRRARSARAGAARRRRPAAGRARAGRPPKPAID